MSSFLKKAAKSILNKAGLVPKGASSKYYFVTDASKVFELEYGHYYSLKEQRAIDKNKSPIPWFTYPAIDYLIQLDFSDKVMLEWGAGNSSLFFSSRVKEIFSVEHNKEWYDKVKSFGLKNQQISFAEEQLYADFPKKFQREFDLILIDGIERNDCSVTALGLLKKDGIIILDNSDRHADIAATFRNNNLIQIDFHGFGPINNYTWTTSIFLSRNVAVKPIGRQPEIPIGGGF
jgi:hypothetical protein